MITFEKWLNESLWDHMRPKQRQQMHKILAPNEVSKNFELAIMGSHIVEISQRKILTSLAPFKDEIEKISADTSRKMILVMTEEGSALKCFVCNIDSESCRAFSKEIAEKVAKELNI